VKERAKCFGAVALVVGIGTLVVSASASAAPVATFSNPQPISIPAFGTASPYPSTITVTGLSGLTTDVNVSVKQFSHTFPKDVGIVLVGPGPGGQALLLQDGAGNAVDVSNVTTTFDDQAAGSLPDTAPWSSGLYKPTNHISGPDSFPAPGPGTSYGNPGPAGGGTATLNGTYPAINPNGTWKLYVNDFVASESGSIAGGWSLQFTTTIADTTAPETTIESAPGPTTARSTATVSFSANEFATFECGLDSAAFAPCTSPQTYSSLSEGPHTIAVRATDPTANVDPTPATTTFTVDTVAPETTIDSGPTGTISSSTASFAFSASEAALFDCKLDSAPFAACASPQAYTGLAEGQHTFQLRATDAAGNVDRTASSRTFSVQNRDTTNPVATIVKPKPKRGKRKAVVAFAATDDRTSIEAITFTCTLDGGAAAPCASPTTYRRLGFGRHTVTVIAKDLAGNASVPASTSFRIRRP
jgi:subtilisin-like proprotein convertase family protein